MATNLKVTELDFDDIKNNLKNFLKRQNEFSSYDFEGSGLNILLDVLAYNTHYNALNAHFSLNESFLDSAQIRGNVVTRAKLLGYIPRSVLSPRAVVNITVDLTGSAGEGHNFDNPLTLTRGTKLRTVLPDGEEYKYLVLNNNTVNDIGEQYIFNNVTLVEGELRELKYRVDNDIENQKFQLSDVNADTSTLRVRVQTNENSNSFDIYTQFESLDKVDSDSKVYYLQENPSGFYEIYFGDGVTGRKPTNNEVVTIDYVITSGAESNGATTFSMIDSVAGFTADTPSTVSASIGGVEKETTESIRFNAPLTFITQNRAVTSEDYASIIKKNFANVDSISTWGGEDNDPPDYGKVYISIKPLLATSLTDSEKNTIKDTILKGKNIVSIVPEIIDPEFTYLELDVFFKYNPNLTDRAPVDLESVIRDTITDYNFDNLNKFDGVFRYSQLTKAIDNADPSIINSTLRPRMYQTFTPTANEINSKELKFAAPFYLSGQSTKMILSSTGFNIGGVKHYFGDIPISGSTKRQVIVYKQLDGENITLIPNAGELDPEKGTIVLNSFTPDDNTAITITVVPNSLDIAPKRNQLLSIVNDKVIITPQVDTIAVGGSSGSIDYTTTSRIK